MSDTPFLDKYTENLTEKVLRKIDSFKLVGRDKEVDDVFAALSCMTKNSPILVGDAGVGKTAIAEGIAARIVRGEINSQFLDVVVRNLELATLMSDEDGGFIIKFKSIIKELKENKADNLLFIDEIHTIMGAGRIQGALDAANVIKPVLSRGEIQLIGATTADEFHDYIEEDEAMERRFQKIIVNEPSAEETVEILEGIREKYEKFHNVKIKNSAIKSSVLLAERYIPELNLPDKALDLIDGACARARLRGQKIITEKAIALMIQGLKGIPVTTILKEESTRLDEVEDVLKLRVKGQNQAVRDVANAVTIARAGMQNNNRPLASFMFLGPTGLGKTELAKALTEAMFDDEHSMIRLDMSEYSQEGSSEKMLGSRKTKGILTEAVKMKPYSVILLDEIEKGNREVHDLLLQILDDGRLTDGRGRLISFKNTIIIMTTNSGAEMIKNNAEIMGTELSERDQMQFLQRITNALMTDFRPEFLNRIGDKIIFNMLDKETIREIAIKNIEILQKRMKKQKAYLLYDAKLLDYLVDNGSDKSNGARPIERFITKKLTAEVSKILLEHRGNEEALFITVRVKGEAPSLTEALERRTLIFSVESEQLKK